MKITKHILIKGIVQGVGFRPFIYRLALKYNLKGFVANDSQGVIVEIEGDIKSVEKFLKDVISKAPNAAKIKEIIQKDISFRGFSNFEIISSIAGRKKEAFIPPDIATCKDCLKELFDRKNRRFGYPFINCTNCGPRYTIIMDIPYDRANTTMKKFIMCENCKAEYEDPLDRRFHAQPNGCFDCGPGIKLLDSDGKTIKEPDPIGFVARELKKGKLLILKGLGGFHLICDAKNEESIKKIRKIKRRMHKPLAIMVSDVDHAKKIALINDISNTLLNSCEAPIVIVEKNNNRSVPSLIAPYLDNIGIMLPYTPLHHILLKEFNGPLVMTSANISGKPIFYKNKEVLESFKSKVDYFLIHNRDIHIRIDDSVVKMFENISIVLRRARGYTPLPIDMGFKTNKTILALGGMLKASLTFLRDNRAILSQYIGDLEEADNFEYYLNILNHFKKLYDFNPDLIVCDLHPDYPTTILAEDLSKDLETELLKVQHHIAHLASAAGEHKFCEEFIGVAFDGTGYGLDGKIWGGEIFTGDVQNLKRETHIKYFPLPTSEKAIKEPWRIAFVFLFKLLGENVFDYEWVKKRKDLYHFENFKQILIYHTNPYTSSVGRLLDGISSMLGIRDKITYEAQAAIELETIADKKENGYYMSPIKEEQQFDPLLLAEAVMVEQKKDVSTAIISARVHNTLARWILKCAIRLREEHGLNHVILSGGVFQNKFLFLKTIKLLKGKGFNVLFNTLIPINDSGISFGQAVVGALKGK